MLFPSAQEQYLSKRHLQTFIVWLCHGLEWLHLSLYHKTAQVYSYNTFVSKKKSNLIPWSGTDAHTENMICIQQIPLAA